MNQAYSLWKYDSKNNVGFSRKTRHALLCTKTLEPIFCSFGMCFNFERTLNIETIFLELEMKIETPPLIVIEKVNSKFLQKKLKCMFCSEPYSNARNGILKLTCRSYQIKSLR